MHWKHKINLNGVISEMNEKYDLSCHEKKCPKEVKAAIAAEIAKAPPLVQFVNGVKACKTIAELNRKLQFIWDEADSARVWCGFPS